MEGISIECMSGTWDSVPPEGNVEYDISVPGTPQSVSQYGAAVPIFTVEGGLLTEVQPEEQQAQRMRQRLKDLLG